MTGMVELIARLAKLAPEEMLIGMIENSIATYKAEKSDKNKKMLAMQMDMLSMKLLSEGVTADELAGTVKDIGAIYDILRDKRKS